MEQSIVVTHSLRAKKFSHTLECLAQYFGSGQVIFHVNRNSSYLSAI